MNRTQRLNAILDLLASGGRVDVARLVATLGVSPATARRDLDTLASQQLLTRTRGGAVGQSVAYDLPIRYKSEQQGREKQLIAHAASALVPRGAVVGLTGGTTTTAVAVALSTRSDLMEASPHANLTVVTCAINIAAQLVMRPQIKTVVTGGVVHPRSYELVGPYADSVLKQITMDFAFIGVNGIDATIGASVHDEAEASINSLIAVRAKHAVIVADSSKIGRRAFATLGGAAGLGLFTTLITDAGISDTDQRALQDSGLEVVVAHA